MKKALFASTALVAGAFAVPQIASAQSVSANNADITLGGYGRFGILYNEATDSTDITSRFRLQIDATAETDAGVTVGARVRLQSGHGGGAGSTAVMSAPRFFARSGGFEVGVGNTFGALDFMPGMYPIDIGLTGLSYSYSAVNVGGFDSFDTTGAGTTNGVEVLYSAGDFSAHVSYSDRNDRLAAHVAYTWNGWTFALGGQDSDDADDTEFAISAGGSFGIADVTLAYAENGNDVGRTVLAARFDVGAATNVEVYVGDEDGASDTAYGIDFNHSLGGGVSLRGGVDSDYNGTTYADLGVRFEF